VSTIASGPAVRGRVRRRENLQSIIDGVWRKNAARLTDRLNPACSIASLATA